MKKLFKIFGVALTLIIIVLLVMPLLFKGQIKDMVKRFINENVNAKVEFSDVSLSLLSSFPQAKVGVDDLVITNYEPFKDETLVTAKSISFEMPFKELFKKAEEGPLLVNSFKVDEAMLTLKTNILGNVNYDISKPSEGNNTSESNNSFSFDVQEYALNNSAITYIDESSKTTFYITAINHSGKGVFSETISELDTNTEAHVSLRVDSTMYLSKNTIKLEALIGLDLENSVYTFKENKGLINQLPLSFQGDVKLLEESQEINVTFENSGSSFTDFLAIIPSEYSKELDNISTTGTFKVKGVIDGLLSDTTIPKLNITVTSNNASFKYPDLPKAVEEININASLINNDGITDNTFLDINTLDFKIDKDVFKSSTTIRNLTKNLLVNTNVDGVLNLANISQAYPIEFDKEMSGILKGKLNSSFDMNAIETNAYQRIKSTGNLEVSNFVFSSDDIVNPINISNANMVFNPYTVTLKNFNAKSGKSDFNATGTINNLLGFLLSDGKLQGRFNVNSNKFAVSDFMIEDTSESSDKPTSDSEALKIPAFLDCTITANAKTVLYDNLTLKNVKGIVIIKDEKAELKNMTSSIFEGDLAISGLVNTKSETPTFNMNLGVKSFDISQSFTQLELLQNLAPIANAVKGKLNTTINLSGSLNNEFQPNLQTVSGNAIAELLTTKIQPENAAILNLLGSNIDFIDFDKIDLKNLKTDISFENGQVAVKPFTLKYQDINITVDGSHGFDKSLIYNAVFDVPAKYLGSDVNRLIGKIDDEAVNDITIPITANIGGTFSAPTVKTDLSSGITSLTKKLVELERQKLINKGKDQLGNIIGDIFNKPKDSTSIKKDSTKINLEKGVKDVLGNLFNNKKKKKDTINEN